MPFGFLFLNSELCGAYVVRVVRKLHLFELIFFAFFIPLFLKLFC